MENKTTITTKKETFLVDINYAGYYRIGSNHSSIAFNLQTKPKWLHRKFCQILLGWRWIDSKNCGS